MNDLKIEMLGTAIKAHQQDREDVFLESILSEPTEAEDVRYLTGVVALCMEQEEQPQTLSELRAAVKNISLTDTQQNLIQYVFMDLLDEGILNMNTDRQLRYMPPETESYINALLMED